MRKPSLLPIFLCCMFAAFNAYAKHHAPLPDSNIVLPEMRLLPVPQQVSFSNQRYLLDDNWFIDAGTIPGNDPAVQSLVNELKERFGITLSTKKQTKNVAGNRIILKIRAGAVDIGATTDTNRTALKKQAYKLHLQKQNISITANAAQGLFYGVQTLIQSLQPLNGKTYFTTGDIVDWPDMDLRIIYWDDAHHLERLDAMKRAIRQASYYKVSGFALKLEGHFQFKSAGPIVEPYAYSAKEYQELTDYAGAHYVELIPYLDAPAHIAFILKHPEYKDLRAFPNSNYDLSVVNPKADSLILNMMDDLFAANKGGKYVLFSTDEAYYAGKTPNDKMRAEALGGNGRLLAEYITRIGNQLHRKGRKAIIWAEYPLRKEDINHIPSHIISGVYNDEWASTIKAHGMRQLIYTSTQGVEPLFPTYYPIEKKRFFKDSLNATDDEEQQGELAKGRVGEVLTEIMKATAAGKSDLMGVFVAGWADAGLNPETFWLGYATGTAAGWNHQSVTAADLTNRFYHSFYGDKTVAMDSVYRLLSAQAQFWERSWQWQPSRHRAPIFGNSFGVFDPPRFAKDQTLPLLPVPSATDLSLQKNWGADNNMLLQEVEKMLQQNNDLMRLLYQNLINVSSQQYNLQVFLTVSQLCRQNLHMLLDLKKTNEWFRFSALSASTNPTMAVALIDQGLDQIVRIRDERNVVFQNVVTTWYQDWFPKVPEANGRTFLHQVDDVKDHHPDRTIDMSYLIYRQLKYPLGEWVQTVTTARNEFAKKNNLPERTATINWESIQQ
ncbi:MAG: family 20 glycosylhydrolase [Chitinophagaceae bacterium]|nr:family 20 glycosylhydrolase [Chitinophagaceae bacterium]